MKILVKALRETTVRAAARNTILTLTSAPDRDEWSLMSRDDHEVLGCTLLTNISTGQVIIKAQSVPRHSKRKNKRNTTSKETQKTGNATRVALLPI